MPREEMIASTRVEIASNKARRKVTAVSKSTIGAISIRKIKRNTVYVHPSSSIREDGSSAASGRTKPPGRNVYL